jgi:hypothetical protein
MKLILTSILAVLAITTSVATAATVNLTITPMDQTVTGGAMATTHYIDIWADTGVNPTNQPVYLYGDAALIDKIRLVRTETGEVVSEATPDHNSGKDGQWVDLYYKHALLAGKTATYDLEVVYSAYGLYNRAYVAVSPAQPGFDPVVNYTGDTWGYSYVSSEQSPEYFLNGLWVQQGELGDGAPFQGIIARWFIAPSDGYGAWVYNPTFRLEVDNSTYQAGKTLGTAANVKITGLRDINRRLIRNDEGKVARFTYRVINQIEGHLSIKGWIYIPAAGITMDMIGWGTKVKTYGLAAKVKDWYVTEEGSDLRLTVNGSYSPAEVAGQATFLRKY